MESGFKRLSDHTLRAVLHGKVEAKLFVVGDKSLFVLSIDGKDTSKVLEELFREEGLQNGDLLRASFSFRKTAWKRGTKRRNESLPAPRSKKALLNEIHDVWMTCQVDKNSYIFVKHLVRRPGDVLQIVLSGDAATDGVYQIQEYRIWEKVDEKTQSHVPVLQMVDFDRVLGPVEKSASTLQRQLLAAGLITPDEWERYFTTDPEKQAEVAKTLPEIVLVET